jgi:hypothetical protein
MVGCEVGSAPSVRFTFSCAFKIAPGPVSVYVEKLVPAKAAQNDGDNYNETKAIFLRSLLTPSCSGESSRKVKLYCRLRKGTCPVTRVDSMGRSTQHWREVYLEAAEQLKFVREG